MWACGNREGKFLAACALLSDAAGLLNARLLTADS